MRAGFNRLTTKLQQRNGLVNSQDVSIIFRGGAGAHYNDPQPVLPGDVDCFGGFFVLFVCYAVVLLLHM